MAAIQFLHFLCLLVIFVNISGFDHINFKQKHSSGHSKIGLLVMGQMGSSVVTSNPIVIDNSKLSYDVKAFENSYTCCTNEVCQVISESIPLDIEGTYFKNAFGKFKIGKETVMHPFDADGMVAAITFQNGKAIFRNRIIETKGYIKEKKTKKISVRGTFGTQKKGGFLANFFDTNLKNTANTNVIYWGNQLLALWEGGLPYRLEADSLRTFGESRIRGILKPKQPLSAHPKIDPHTNRLVTFSKEQKDMKTSVVTVYEFDDKFDMVKNRSFEIPGFSFFHDWVVTENYYIFSQAAASFNLLPFLLGFKSPADCITFFTETMPVKMYLVPRSIDTKVSDAASDATSSSSSSLPSDIQLIELPPHFNAHFGNGYEDKATGNIIVDVIESDKNAFNVEKQENTPIWINLDYENTAPYSKLDRFTLIPPLTSSAAGWTYTRENMSQVNIEFPSINPAYVGKKYRYLYGVCGTKLAITTPFQGIVKLDLISGTDTQWLPEKYEFVSEATFVPRKSQESVSSVAVDEDDGYLAAYLTNGRDFTSEFLLFNASNISIGPILRVPLPTYIPQGLHGSYSNGLVFKEEDISRKFKVNRALDSKQTGRNGWNDMKGGFSGLGLSYDMD